LDEEIPKSLEERREAESRTRRKREGVFGKKRIEKQRRRRDR